MQRNLRIFSFSTSTSCTTFYETFLHYLTEIPSSISHLHQIHSLIITNGFSSKSVLACRLVKSYSNLYGAKHAHNIFAFLPNKTTDTYNYMLNAHVKQNNYESVFEVYSTLLFEEEVFPDQVTFSIVLKACIGLKLEREGQCIHGHVLVTGSDYDLRLSTDLLHFYLKCSCLMYAKKLFALMPQRDVFVWTSMIDGLLKLGVYDDAQKYFKDMRVSGLKPSIVTWNALISGFARGGLYNEVLYHINVMQMEGIKPGNVLLSSILPMFAENAILKPGLEVHAFSIRHGLELDLYVVSSLVDMYAKCGMMEVAQYLFDRCKIKDIGLWNVIIVGYGMHGNCKEAISLFDKMIDTNVGPNEITFTAILSACSHRGIVDEGLHIFNLMIENYKISARNEHYACMVDMLGRAKLLQKAYDLIMKMPIKPNKDVWGAFLNACRIHSHVKYMEIAAKHMAECNKSEESTGYHVMMSNMYAENGKWGEVVKLRRQMRDGRMKKQTGYSWIEIGDVVHVFSMGDFSHPRFEEINVLLKISNDDMIGVSVVI